MDVGVDVVTVVVVLPVDGFSTGKDVVTVIEPAEPLPEFDVLLVDVLLFDELLPDVAADWELLAEPDCVGAAAGVDDPPPPHALNRLADMTHNKKRICCVFISMLFVMFWSK